MSFQWHDPERSPIYQKEEQEQQKGTNDFDKHKQNSECHPQNTRLIRHT
jgi:hypothetical protein